MCEECVIAIINTENNCIEQLSKSLLIIKKQFYYRISLKFTVQIQ